MDQVESRYGAQGDPATSPGEDCETNGSHPSAKEAMWSSLLEAWNENESLRKENARLKGAVTRMKDARARDKDKIRALSSRLDHAINDLAKRARKASRAPLQEQREREQRLEDMTGY